MFSWQISPTAEKLYFKIDLQKFEVVNKHINEWRHKHDMTTNEPINKTGDIFFIHAMLFVHSFIQFLFL